MRNIFLLTKVLFKSGGNMEFGRKKSNKTGKLSNIGGIFLYLLLALCFIPFGIGIYTMMDGMYKSLNLINQGSYVIALSFLIVSFVIFFFAMFSIASVLFYSKDIGYLLPLPFKPREITLSKFLYILFGEYFIEAIFIIPTYAVWIVNNGVSPLFIIAAIIVFLVTPVFPILIAAIIIMPIMRFSGLTKHKDAFTVVSSMLGLVIALGINLVSSKVGGIESGDKLEVAQKIMQTKDGFLKYVSGIFVNAKLGTQALIGSSTSQILINLVLLLLIVAIALMLFVALSDVFYLKGVMSISDSASKKTKISKEDFEKSTNMNSQVATLVKREIKILMRTPVYLLNCISTIIIIPICFVPMLFVNKGGLEISNLGASIQNNGVKQGIVLVVTYAMVAFMAGVSPTASTAISREGSTFFVSQYIPVDYMKQIVAKIIPSIVLNSITVLFMAIFAAIALKLDVMLVLIATIIGILVVCFTSMLGIIIDITRPKLVWNGEEQAVKQNLNSFIAFIVSAVILGICIIPVIMFCLDTLWLTATVIVGILAILNVAVYFIVKTYGVNRFKSIE